MAFGDADIPTLLKDFGEDFTVGAVTAKGPLDKVDKELLRSDAAALVGRVMSVRLQTSAFGSSLIEGATITRVSTGAAYKIISAHQQPPDGLVTLVTFSVP